MGELFNTQHEYVPLIANRLIDFIRIHISQIGGLSMARKVAALAEFFGVKTAWHGPGDVSPVGHAAGLALELASYNFGIHEGGAFPDRTREVFPGCPETKDGFLYANEAPGLGIDIDETLAAKFPASRQPDLRSSLGHDPQPRRDGDPAVRRVSRSGEWQVARESEPIHANSALPTRNYHCTDHDLDSELRPPALLAALDADRGVAGALAVLRAPGS